jgi:hypothetical protein
MCSGQGENCFGLGSGMRNLGRANSAAGSCLQDSLFAGNVKKNVFYYAEPGLDEKGINPLLNPQPGRKEIQARAGLVSCLQDRIFSIPTQRGRKLVRGDADV